MKNKKTNLKEELINQDEIFNQILQLGEEAFNLKSNLNEAERLKKIRELNKEITRLSKIHKECIKKKKEEYKSSKEEH